MSRPARVTMKDGSRSRVIKVPCAPPIRAQAMRATMTAAHHGQFVVTGWTSCTAMAPPTADYEADGEVDLSQEQGEDLGHRQDHEHRTLLEEVDDVPGRQEDVMRAHHLEHDGGDDQAEEDREHPALAALDAEHLGAQILPQRLGQDLGRDERRSAFRCGRRVYMRFPRPAPRVG